MYNVDLPAQLPMESDGEFFIQPLPDAWKDILWDIPYVGDILENSRTHLAGGLLRDLVSSEPPDSKKTDVDFFFRSDREYQIIKEYFTGMDGIDKIFQCPEDKLTTFFHKETQWKFQCIAIDFYPTLFDTVSSFDFTACCFGTDGDNFIFHKNAIKATLDRILTWNKITYPAASLRRMMKYALKGYRMPESELQYFCECLAEHHPDIIDKYLVYID